MRRLSLLVVLGLVLMSTSLTASEKIVLVARDFDNRPISGLLIRLRRARFKGDQQGRRHGTRPAAWPSDRSAD